MEDENAITEAVESKIEGELDSFSYHEALDRAWVVLSTLESILGEHPVIRKEPEAKVLYDQAVENLGALYQKLGAISADR